MKLFNSTAEAGPLPQNLPSFYRSQQQINQTLDLQRGLEVLRILLSPQVFLPAWKRRVYILRWFSALILQLDNTDSYTVDLKSSCDSFMSCGSLSISNLFFLHIMFLKDYRLQDCFAKVNKVPVRAWQGNKKMTFQIVPSAPRYLFSFWPFVIEILSLKTGATYQYIM